MDDLTITIRGNLTADPELRFVPAGDAVSNFTIAHQERKYDKSTQSWVDGDTVFMRCNAWRSLAENIAESIKKGDRVVAYGRLKQRSFETREGEKRSVIELEVEEIGPSLRYATAKPEKANR